MILLYKIWHSTESFAKYLVEHTDLSKSNCTFHKLIASDASSHKFHTIPDHIRKILYLDCPDIIVEYGSEPIFSIEISTEAGTGHNVFQRFARIAASVENDVPAFYIYPKGKLITRQIKKSNGSKTKNIRFDNINPLIFRALDSIMNIYHIPALYYYFPTNIKNISTKGISYDKDKRFRDCPDSLDTEMQNLFLAINELLSTINAKGIIEGRKALLGKQVIQDRRNYMASEWNHLSSSKKQNVYSPLSSTYIIKTSYLLNYLKQYETSKYNIGQLLKDRDETILYKINAEFRGDPYPGCLAAIDYLQSREGRTYEERKRNIVLFFGDLSIDHINHSIKFSDNTTPKSTIKLLFDDVKSSDKHNILNKDYSQLKSSEVPRYFMQMRYGSTYSKAKHIRVYSYFADAILFPDGALWRDA